MSHKDNEEYSHLLASVRATVDSVRRSGDLTLTLRSEVTDAATLLELILGDSQDPEAWNTLGWFYWHRHLVSLDTERDQDAAIGAFIRVGVFDGPVNAPDEAMSLVVQRVVTNLLILHRSLLESVESTGQLAADVVTGWRYVLSIAPMADPARAMYLSNLALALALSFDRSGARSDLDEAIETGRRASEEMLADDPRRGATLTNLGAALLDRFDLLGLDADLDESIEVQSTAAHLVADEDVHRRAISANMANAFGLRFERRGDRADLDKAIDYAERAVSAGGPDTPALFEAKTSLAAALTKRFRATGQELDLHQAIDIILDQLHTAPEDHPGRAASFYNLGWAYHELWESTQDLTCRSLAVKAFTDCLMTPSVDTVARINAAVTAANLVGHDDPGEAARLMESALHLLPAVAPRHLPRADRQRSVARFHHLGPKAAAYTLSDASLFDRPGEQASRALRLLELGRAPLLNQSLDTRVDVRQLRSLDADLAERFLRLRRELDVASSAASITFERHRLTSAYEATLESIRSLAGFSAFMRATDPDERLAVSLKGPVAVFNITGHRCDALLLMADEVRSVRLERLNQEDLVNRIVAFRQALRDSSATEPYVRAGAEDTISEILEWLWDVAAEPVLAALGFHETPPEGSSWPRMWWVPGGLLGFLPFQAAGYHRPLAQEQRRTVIDRVVSSTAPSIRALYFAQQNDFAPEASAEALIVAMPHTPGHSNLPCAASEAAAVQRYFPRAVVLGADGGESDRAPATKPNMLMRLQGCTFLHFAGHCVSDVEDPSLSALLLEDHRTDPLTFASLSEVVSDGAYLAFLSGCQTALPEINALAHEAIHPATALLLTGFPHVIGTLWEIDDRLAFRFAEEYYATLLSRLPPVSPAHVLHDVVRASRDSAQGNFPSVWASHVHVGA
ncbi:CHAT domain-containing protein [Nonomuraea sp. NPDC049714]|uniref:CHAT domain-containing protein n=1 Tax=Nonomuraea sp. NPDC049714 TaxID=3364357 RepID=UPI0037B02664